MQYVFLINIHLKFQGEIKAVLKNREGLTLLVSYEERRVSLDTLSIFK
jgi:hypothetical protein